MDIQLSKTFLLYLNTVSAEFQVLYIWIYENGEYLIINKSSCVLYVFLSAFIPVCT